MEPTAEKLARTLRELVFTDPELYVRSVRAGVVSIARWAWSRDGLQPGND